MMSGVDLVYVQFIKNCTSYVISLRFLTIALSVSSRLRHVKIIKKFALYLLLFKVNATMKMSVVGFNKPFPLSFLN